MAPEGPAPQSLHDELRSAERYRAIVEDLPEMVARFLPDGTMTFANGAYCRYFGVRREEFIGTPYKPVIHPDDFEAVQAQVATLTPESPVVVIQNRALRADGAVRWTEWTNRALYDKDGRLLELQSAGRDITERRAAEEATARLAAIVASADDAIYSTTLDGTITSWNRAAERLFGYTADEAIGRPIRIILPERQVHLPNEQAQERLDIRERIEHGETIKLVETEKVAKNGARVPVSLTLSPIAGPGGRIIGISRIARDITELREMERQRQLAVRREAEARKAAEQASRLKDDFLAVVSHELRTPLNAILGWSRMLRDGGVTGGAVQKALDTIERNARMQAQLIEDLLDVSSIAQGRLALRTEPVNLAPIILAAVEAVQPSAARKDIALHVDLPDDDLIVSGDAGRLQQAVWNLLVNATKFTQTGGRIDVQLRADEREALLSVRDNGVGIPAEALPYIFDRFRQADSRTIRAHGGLGLGLTIVSHVAESLGGAVRAYSEGPGRGATFELTLPMMAPAVSRLGPAPDRRGSLQGLRVLVVDDEADARDLAQTILEACGAHVRTAPSVADAIAAARAELPDVMVGDIGMPEQDGFDLIRLFRGLEGAEHLPAVALTAYSTGENREAALRAGFDVHLGKPIDPEALCSVLARLSQARRPARQE